MADISQIKLPSDSIGKNIKALKLPYGECSTAAGTAAKVVTIKTDNNSSNSDNMPFVLEKGVVVLVRFTVTNTAAVANLTLSINGTTAKGIKYRNDNLAAAEDLAANRTYMFTYDGTYWQFIGDFNTSNGGGGNTGIIAPDFDPSTTYSLGDYCIYEDNLYYYNNSTASSGAWNSTKWTGTTVAGELGTINAILEAVL